MKKTIYHLKTINNKKLATQRFKNLLEILTDANQLSAETANLALKQY